MAKRLADRLSAARHGQFVGRTSERLLFELSLTSAGLPFSILHVHGPGGIGKTTLLREFAGICREAGVPCINMDGRDIEPGPEPFTRAFREHLEDNEATERFVLFVDTYELLAPLDAWFRETFLPELPDSVIVVLASRNPPSPPWRVDPGWQSLIRTLPLANLTPEESRLYLRNRNVPDAEHEVLLDFTHGHPLALSLVADVVEHLQGRPFRPEQAPDTIKTLIEHFVQQVPTPMHRKALEVCALLRFTTEAVLAEVLHIPDAHEMFEWMRRLSFVESGSLGLIPHDLAREALSADVRWRNPDWYDDLHDRARAYYSRRLTETTGPAQERVLSDYAYLHRDNPIIRPFLEWQGSSGAAAGQATVEEWPRIREIIEQHEGTAAAGLATHWFENRPDSVVVFRNGDQAAGICFFLPLHDVTEEERAVDPAVAKALEYLSRKAPLRHGERATHFRFWMAADSYQDVSATQSHIFLKIAQHYLTAPELAFSFLPVSDPDFWAPFCAYVDLFRIPDADFEVGGKRYGVYGHDWRVVPPAAWLNLLAERETSTAPTIPPAVPANGSGGLLVLNEAEFLEAVRDALRVFPRPDKMLSLSLLRSRMVSEKTGADGSVPEQVDALRELLTEAASALEASPRDARLFRVLHRTYFNPARSQEEAAELLDLPFSTYRRYLKKGVEQVATWLWQYEIGAAPEQSPSRPGEELARGN